jgi:hypothetical protein
MGFGLWQKIKNGVKKVIGGIGKAAKWVHEKVLKPAAGIVKPIAGVVAPVIDKYLPGAGAAIHTGLEILSPSKNGLPPQDSGGGTDLIVPRLKNMVGVGGAGIRRMLG